MGQTVITLPAPEQRVTGTRPRRWTREEYYRAAECGVFKPGERLELLNGEILQKMSPQRPPHATVLTMTAVALGKAFGSSYYVRQQLPLVLNDESEPRPPGRGSSPSVIRGSGDLGGRAAAPDERPVALEFPAGPTPADAAARLASRYPALAWLRRATKPAVNLEYTTWDHPLQDGD